MKKRVELYEQIMLIDEISKLDLSFDVLSSQQLSILVWVNNLNFEYISCYRMEIKIMQTL